MDVQYINPFITSTIHVIKTMSSVDVSVGKPYLKKDEVARGDVSGIIGLIGMLKEVFQLVLAKNAYSP